MQGGIVCVMILEKEGRTGRVDVSGASRAVYWLDNIYYGCMKN